MNPTKVFPIAFGGVLLLLAGCATEPVSHLITAPPPGAPTSNQQVIVTPPPQQVIVAQPQQVVTTVATSGATTSYVVLQAPPAPQAPQAIPSRPSAQHVWIDGFWTWRNSRYEWMAGHWEVPPYSGAKWINPRVEPEAGSFRFYEGRWN